MDKFIYALIVLTVISTFIPWGHIFKPKKKKYIFKYWIIGMTAGVPHSALKVTAKHEGSYRLFSDNTLSEQEAENALKKYLMENYPTFRIEYVLVNENNN